MTLNGECGGVNFIVCQQMQNMLATHQDQSFQHVYFDEHHKIVIE